MYLEDEMDKKVGVEERDILIGKKWFKEVVIIYNDSTKKGRGVSQIIDGLKRIIT